MSIITPTARVTPEDLLNLPDSAKYELVDGKLVERNMGFESSEIAARILVLIGIFLRTKPLGHLATTDAGYRCFPNDPQKIRRPDVSFIRAGRLPADKAPQGYSMIPPDLAVEVISPGDLAYEIEEKVAEYLKVGVPLVWVVNPPTRTVRIHRQRTAPLGSISELTEADTISGEDVLPGFSCGVKEFFA